MTSRFRRLAMLFAAALATTGPRAQAPEETPLPSDLETSIEVRLVTVDLVALDADERTVADLGKDDLVLRVDGKLTTIDTFDAFCASGAEPDPEGPGFGEWQTPKDLEQGIRRIVLAFDYLHLPYAPCPDGPGPCFYHTQSLRDFQGVLAAKTDISDEEMMVVALTGGLRVEQPFTKDRAAVVDTLHRMEHDITLWNGNFAHLTEQPLFTSLRALVTVLRTQPGPKSVVFISAGPGPGDFYEPDFEQLAAAAGEAEVAFYTVDCMGLSARVWTGGPPWLARLASMTGGRLTRNTNDTTIGYARARRDAGCRYSVGFYDRHPELNKRHVISVESRRAGVHVFYADRYTFPSKEERQRMAIEAVYLVPAQFEGGGLRAHLFPLQPNDRKTWNAILVVDFPVAFEGATTATKREFGVVLRRGPEVVHTFNRSVTLERPEDDPKAAPRVTFVEPVTVSPGSYALTAVLTDPDGDRPFGRVADLTVPAIPKRQVVLAGPILGRRRGDDVVVYGGGDEKGAEGDRVGNRAAFRPLLIDDVDRTEPLAALTHVCVLGAKRKDGPWSLSRTLETADGVAAGSLDDIVFRPSGREPVQCERLLDEVPTPKLKPGRYTFRAVVAQVGGDLQDAIRGAAPFAVSGGADPSPGSSAPQRSDQ